MEPQIVEKPEMRFVGLVGCGADVSQLDISGLWQRFNDHAGNIKNQVEGRAYEVHIEEEVQPRMHFCLVGVEVQEFEDIPIELFAKVLPACRYAVFTHRFKDGGYGFAFERAYGWLKSSNYTSAHSYDIQCYDERFKGNENPESVLEIFLPIQKR